MSSAPRCIVYLGSATVGHQNNTPDTSAPLIELWRQMEYDVHFASNASVPIIRLIHQLWTVVTQARKNPIVVIDTYSTRSFYGAVLLSNCCLLLGLKYMPILHGGLLPKRLSSKARFTQAYFAKAARLIAPSAYLARYAGQQGWPVAIIPNGLDLEDYPFNPQTSPENKQHMLNPKILWLRAFDAIYRPELALEIFKLIQEHYPQAELYMVGPDKGGRMAACKKYAAQNQLKVHFPGKLSKPHWKEIAQECSIFLNTSSIDNAPVSVSEAMALGLVVVSAHVGGMGDLLDHGRAGFLIDEPCATGDISANQSHALAFSAVITDLLKGRIDPASQILKARTLAEQQDWSTLHDLWTRVLTKAQ